MNSVFPTALTVRDQARAAAALTERRRTRRIPENHEPEDKESLGHTIWEIIGSTDEDLFKAAKLFDIPASTLNAFMHGNFGFSKEKIKNWRGILNKNYPDTPEHLWKEYGKRHMSLPTKRGRRSFEPVDKESYGHQLWVILGGKKINVKLSAKRLGFKNRPSNLSDILHGKWKPSKEWLEEMNWDDILIIYYVKTWEQKQQWKIYKICESKLTPYSHKGRAPVRNTKSLERKTKSCIQGKTL